MTPEMLKAIQKAGAELLGTFLTDNGFEDWLETRLPLIQKAKLQAQITAGEQAKVQLESLTAKAEPLEN